MVLRNHVGSSRALFRLDIPHDEMQAGPALARSGCEVAGRPRQQIWHHGAPLLPILVFASLWLGSAIRLSAPARTEGASSPLALAGDLPAAIVRQVVTFVPPLVAVSVKSTSVELSLGGADAGLEPRPSWQSRILRHAGIIAQVLFFPAGDRLLTAGDDGRAVVWSVVSGGPLQQLHVGQGLGVAILDVKMFDDGERVVAVGADRSATVWSADTGEVLQRMDSEGICGGHRSVLVLPGGDAMVTGVSQTPGDPAVVWSVSGGLPLHLVQRPSDTLSSIAVSPCGGLLAAGWGHAMSWCGRADGGGAADGDVARALGLAQPRRVDQRRRAGVCAGPRGCLCVGRRRGELLRKISVGRGVFVDAFLVLPGPRVLVLAAGAATLWDIETDAHLGDLQGVIGRNPRAAVSSSAEIVAICGGVSRFSPADSLAVGIAETAMWHLGSGRRLRTLSHSPLPSSEPWFSVAPPFCRIR